MRMGRPVCEVSDYVIKAVEVGTVFPEGLRADGAYGHRGEGEHL